MKWSYRVWGGAAAAFTLIELLPALGVPVPWKTLSSTVHDVIDRTDGIAAIPIVGGLTVLGVHLVAPQVFERHVQRVKAAVRRS